mmetsp:Transcript_17186/g.37830  ORF Transcript_17186/g.37830 Transcript_17186/m.37830 type:complete len:588 (+) Transcript_17186:84-1847(+)
MTLRSLVLAALVASIAVALNINSPVDGLSSVADGVTKAADDVVMMKGGFFPVPTTTRCIVIIMCQYMIIYTALAVCRSYHELSETPKGKVESGLRAAAQTLTYGPMLCVLFIACRLRVEFLSDGKDQPQMWVQRCMYFVTFSVMLSTLVVLLIPVLTGKPMPLKPGTCDLEKPTEDTADGNPNLLIALSVTRYVIMLGLYGGLAGIITGIHVYTPPGVSDVTKLPAPAPAVMCTMILAVIFFLTQIVIAAARSYTEYTGKETAKLVGVMNGAAATVEFAPMLSILFLAARMRALQYGGQPQEWAQNAMFASTASIAATAILAIAVPLALGGTQKTHPISKETTFEVPDPTIGWVLLGLRYVFMACIYGGAAVVVASIFLFESSPGVVPPISPAVSCVCNLCCQYFFVYLVLIVCLSVSEVSGGKYPLEQSKFFAAVDSTKATMAYAPMLSILFVTTRMYALLITDKKGAPQAWCQDGMYMATWSVMIAFILCLATGAVMDKVETDEDGNVVNKFTNKYVGIGMTAARYLAMVLLYGGIITVIVGVFSMTPETANGRGSIPLVSDAINSTPIGNAPPSLGSAASAMGF